MQKYRNRIITASAGTGKTYRLSLEYIAIVLQYFNYPGFRLDSILALTFTKKATAEIRERILGQLQLLTTPCKEQTGLVSSLRTLVPGPETELTKSELQILQLARMQITADQNNLQVMTIDSYISNIFRNIVRPLRSIDSYEIDVDAIDKRMPFLLNHLMLPEFRGRVNRLLVRKINRSLDTYGKFFKSMIQNRWLYYLIKHRFIGESGSENNSNAAEQTMIELKRLLVLVESFASSRNSSDYAAFFNSAFREALGPALSSSAEAIAQIANILSSPFEAYRFFKVLVASNIYNGGKIKDKSVVELLQEAQNFARQYFADMLYDQLFLKEQEEILEIWQCILTEYDRLIYRYKNMTYDDVSWFSFEALFSSEPPNFDLSDAGIATEFYEFLSHRTRFLLIDEFQDTSLIQFNILKPVMEEITAGIGTRDYGGLIVVGDEKQSIFGWRGGERDLLLNLPEIIPTIADVEPEALNRSWRSTPQMMEAINYIFRHPLLKGYLDSNNMSWKYPVVHSAIPDDLSIIELLCSPYSTYGDPGSKHRMYREFVRNMILPALPEQDNPEAAPRSIAILCRKGNQLAELQLALEEVGQTSIFQPSASIVEHALVAPLLKWLRFRAYGDWLDFLGFLRSDYMRINSTALKAITDIISHGIQHSALEQETPMFEDFPEIQALYELSCTAHDVYPALREIVEICLDPEQLKQRDAANLQAFLALTKTWELNYQHKGKSIPDFLAYLAENATQEDFKQVSVEGEQNIQLLTIHKSKGLQFDQVFVFYDLSSAGRKDTDKLVWALKYADRGFDKVSEYALTYHYEDILRQSSHSELWQHNERRALLEELNTLYVAFTRAKTRLHICFAYNGRKTWDKYISDKDEDSLKLPTKVAAACVDFFRNLDISPNVSGIYRLYNDVGISTLPEKPIAAQTPKSMGLSFDPRLRLASYMPPPIQSFEPIEQIPGLDWPATYLHKRQNLIGDLVHFFLSFIKSDLEDEYTKAHKACLYRYGSVLSQEQIQRILGQTRSEITKHAYVFDPSYPHIFTEFTITSNRGALRIDRLMVDPKGQRILIIDYKTGAIHEKDQLEVYAAAVRMLPAFRDADYQIEQRYVMLNVTGQGARLDQ